MNACLSLCLVLLSVCVAESLCLSVNLSSLMHVCFLSACIDAYLFVRLEMVLVRFYDLVIKMIFETL